MNDQELKWIAGVLQALNSARDNNISIGLTGTLELWYIDIKLGELRDTGDDESCWQYVPPNTEPIIE